VTAPAIDPNGGQLKDYFNFGKNISKKTAFFTALVTNRLASTDRNNIQADLTNNRIQEVVMKSLISAVVVASALIVPAVSFAQQANAPVTRAQVRAEVVAAQQAGLLNQNDVNYPKTVPQSATAVAAVAQGSQDMGGVKATSWDSGAPVSVQQQLFSTYRGQ
jgi:hypothetical protein